MKKLKLIILLGVILTTLTGCIKKDSYDNITIYTTVYPIEYITDYLYGSHSEIYSIYPNGADINNYTITNKKLNDFAKADMFIYNGLVSEKDVAANLINKNSKMDIIDVSKGLEIKNNVTELWLSPSNFLMMTSNVKNGLKDFITNSNISDSVDQKYEELKLTMSELDAELKIVAESTSNKRIITADNAFKFLEKYGFEVISISSSDENSNTNISKAKNYFSAKTNSYLFKLSDTEENDTIKSLVSSGATIVNVPNMYTLTEEQRKNNVDYVSLIKNFIESIKSEVY